MSTKYTMAEIAEDYELWEEYVDPQATMTEAEFDALTTEEKVAMQREMFPYEAAEEDEAAVDRMNILSTAEALAAINARLARPISRQAFAHSIIPLMLARGDCRRLGSAGYAFDADAVRMWASYCEWREAQIASGKLPPKHPYSTVEMEDHLHGEHDEA